MVYMIIYMKLYNRQPVLSALLCFTQVEQVSADGLIIDDYYGKTEEEQYNIIGQNMTKPTKNIVKCQRNISNTDTHTHTHTKTT